MDPLAEASKDASTQTTTTAPLINPLMTPAKEQRILIWRTEVASALSLPTSSHSSESTTSAASPGLDDIIVDDIIADDELRQTPEPISPLPPASSRPRSLWKRISWRFSRHRGSPPSSPDAQRTSMYRADRPRQLTGDEALDGEGGFPNKFSDDGAGNALQDKHDRLQRAARLLNQGVRQD